MELSKYKKLIFRISLMLCVAFFILTLYFGYAYVHSPSQMLKYREEFAKVQARDAAQEIGFMLANMETISDSIQGLLYFWQREDDDEILQQMKNMVEEQSDLCGIVVAYKPYAYDLEKRLYAPYYVRKNGEIQLIQVEDKYDYTQPDSKDGTGPRTLWYHQPLEESDHLIEPFFGTASETLVTGYSIPFYRINASKQDKIPIGIICTLYSLDGVRDRVSSLDLGCTGYGFIITEKDVIVSHPIKEYLGKNINNIRGADQVLEAVKENITFGDYQIIHNNFTGQTSWVFYEPIPSANWTLGVVFVEDEVLRGIDEQRRQLLIQAALSLIAFLSFLSVILFGAYKGGLRSLWAVAIGFSVLCIIGTSFIWYLALEDPFDEDHNDVVILDRVGLEATLHKQIDRSDFEDRRIQVPTGIFVQCLEFLSANNVLVTGYVWQKCPENTGNDLTPGVIFPEVEDMNVEEYYRDDDLIGWHFKAVLRQKFDYSKYPFDRSDIRIRFWHRDFHRNIILTPDLESYAFIRPELKPGLESDLVLEGWNVQNSFFSYRNNSYSTNFGVKSYDHGNSPELYFNIDVKRIFLGIFISNFITLVVVVLLVFAVLMISTRHEQQIKSYGFVSSLVLLYCAAILFVLIVSHVSLREKLVASGIIYLEYFFFVMYFAILAVSVNSILLASETEYSIIHYRDNLIVKLLYWPVISGLILGFTLAVFY